MLNNNFNIIWKITDRVLTFHTLITWSRLFFFSSWMDVLVCWGEAGWGLGHHCCSDSPLSLLHLVTLLHIQTQPDTHLLTTIWTQIDTHASTHANICQWGEKNSKNSYFQKQILVTKTHFPNLRSFYYWKTLFKRIFFRKQDISCWNRGHFTFSRFSFCIVKYVRSAWWVEKGRTVKFSTNTSIKFENKLIKFMKWTPKTIIIHDKNL